MKKILGVALFVGLTAVSSYAEEASTPAEPAHDETPIQRNVKEVEMDQVIMQRIAARAKESDATEANAESAKKHSPIVDVWKKLQQSVDDEIQ